MKKISHVLTALVLVLGACSGSSGDTTTTTAGGDETTTTSSESTTTTAAETTTTVAETTTTASAGAGGGEECIVGTWVLDNAAFFAAVFEEMGDVAGMGEITPNDGVFSTTFESDGTVQAVREDWGFSIETDEGTFMIVINGEQSGTWEADDSTLTLNLDEGTGFDVEASVLVDGQEVPLPSAPIDVPTEALSTSSQYSCGSDMLTVANEGVTSVFERS